MTCVFALSTLLLAGRAGPGAGRPDAPRQRPRRAAAATVPAQSPVPANETGDGSIAIAC